MQAYTSHFANHGFTIVAADDYYRLERDDGRVREVRRARQDEPVQTTFLMNTERSIHPLELDSFRSGVWRAIWDMAA